MNIPGAVSNTYEILGASLSESGSSYDCVISNNMGTIASDAAILTVNPDNTAPRLLSVNVVDSGNIRVVFNEPISKIGNYMINNGVKVLSATLDKSEREIHLAVDGLVEDDRYTLAVSDVMDKSSAGNTIPPLSSLDFVFRSVHNFEDGAADSWSPLNPSRWEVILDNGDYAYHISTTAYDNLSGQRLGEYSLLPGFYSNFIMSMQSRLDDSVNSNAYADYAVILGYQDPQNYYYMMFNNEQSATQFFKVENNSRTLLASANTDWLNDNLYHSIRIEVMDDKVTVFFDDNVVLTVEVNNPVAGQVGVGSYNDSAFFDDIRVTEQQTGVRSGNDASSSNNIGDSSNIVINSSVNSNGLQAASASTGGGGGGFIDIYMELLLALSLLFCSGTRTNRSSY